MKKIYLASKNAEFYSSILSKLNDVENIVISIVTGSFNSKDYLHNADIESLFIIENDLSNKLLLGYLESMRKNSFTTIFISFFNSTSLTDAFKNSQGELFTFPKEEKLFFDFLNDWIEQKIFTDNQVESGLMLNFPNQDNPLFLKRIIVPTFTGFELLPITDIVYCSSVVNYTTIWLKNKSKLIVAKTLGEFEKLLSPHNFFRVHNSHLVNLGYIKSYRKGKGGSIALADGTEIEVSTRRKEAFLAKISSL